MILLFIGYKGSGKDTSFELLKKHYPEYERVAIGDVVKETTAQMFAIPLSEMHDISTKEKHRSKINECNEIELAKDPYIFVKKTIEKADKYLQAGKKIVCTGVRLKHEHDMWIDYANTSGYKITTILIYREDHSKPDHNDHEYEKDFLNIKPDYRIVNKTLEVLENELKDLLGKLHK